MKRLLGIFFLAPLLAMGAVTTHTLTVTNTAITSNTVTWKGVTRIFTNATTATLIQTNLAGPKETATNVFNAFGGFPPSGGVNIEWASPTSMVFRTIDGQLSVAGGGQPNWAFVTTNSVATTNYRALMAPQYNIPGANAALERTNTGDYIADYLNYSRTVSIASAAISMSNFLSVGATVGGGTQRISAPKTFDSLAGTIGGFLYDGGLSNVAVSRLNFKPFGATTSGTNFGVIVFFDRLTNQTATLRANSNGIPSLYDSASANPWHNDELFVALSTNNWGAIANMFSIVTQFPLLSAQPNAGRYSNSIAIPNYWTSPTNTFANGLNLPGGYIANGGSNYNGVGSNTTEHSLTGSNVVLSAGGTNVNKGDMSAVMFSIATVANGENTIDVGTNLFIKLTGAPTAAWSLGGITGGNRDGKEIEIYNATGYTVTIVNESGTEPTASKRIITLNGANVASVGNCYLFFRYDAGQSRWILRTMNAGTGAGGGALSFNANQFANPSSTVTIKDGAAITNPVVAHMVLTATTEGQIWNDATQRVLSVYNSGVTQRLSGTIASLTNSVACANTTTETSFFPLGSIVGNTNLSTTFWAPGKRIRVDVSGIWQASGAISKTFRVRIGSATPVSLAFTPGGAIGPGIRFRFVATLTCRATGSSGTVVQSAMAEMWTSASAVSYAVTASSSTTTINTTVAHAIDVTVAHSSAGASDTITAVEGTIEVLD